MACFIVPVTEAIITTAAQKILESKEKKNNSLDNNKSASLKAGFSKKLGWLNKLLWGGSALLAFEHVWHGEVVPFFPFLTAMSSPESTAEMLHEMSTVGVGMAVLITAVWAVMVGVSKIIEKRPADKKVLSAQKA